MIVLPLRENEKPNFTFDGILWHSCDKFKPDIYSSDIESYCTWCSRALPGMYTLMIKLREHFTYICK